MTSLQVRPGPVTEARAAYERELGEHLVALRAHCYRMLGSAADAEDAAQDALVRAWRHLDTFEGRSSLRSWLYRIATNVCLDVLDRRTRRALPADLASPAGPGATLGAPLAEDAWVEPVADSWVVPPSADPAEAAVVRDSVRLAFVAALQMLPPRQRAALVLREVLGWRPPEIAELLDTTVVSVNSALQRARQRLTTLDAGPRATPPTDIPPDLLERYVEAFQHYDVEALVALLHEDATWTMPPYDLWFRGVDAIADWVARKPCGQTRFVPLALNGTAGFACYRATGRRDRYDAFGVQVLEVREGAIAAVDTFLDPGLVTRFGLSATLDG